MQASGIVAINGGATSTAGLSVAVGDPATDANGLASVRLSNYPSVDTNGLLSVSASTYTYADPVAWTLGAGPAGMRTVYIQWQDAAGNWSPVSNASIEFAPVDTTPPVMVGTPASGWYATVPMRGSSVPLRVSWPAAADPGSPASGVAYYLVQQSRDAGVYITVVSPTATSASIFVASGHTYRYRIAAVDYAGNVGSYTYSPTLKPIGVQESSRSIVYSRAWRTYSSPTYAWGGHSRYSAARGASASFRFSERSIAWETPRFRSSGRAYVYDDGHLRATINLYSVKSQARIVVFARNWSVVGTHTIKVVVLSTAGHPRVDLDSFIVLR